MISMTHLMNQQKNLSKNQRRKRPKLKSAAPKEKEDLSELVDAWDD